MPTRSGRPPTNEGYFRVASPVTRCHDIRTLGSLALASVVLAFHMTPHTSRLLLLTAAPSVERSEPIDDILITPQLARRPTRPPDHGAEVAALQTVARSFASSPAT